MSKKNKTTATPVAAEADHDLTLVVERLSRAGIEQDRADGAAGTAAGRRWARDMATPQA